MIIPFKNGRMLLVTKEGADKLCLAAGIDLSKSSDEASPEVLKKYDEIQNELFEMVMGDTIKETEHFFPRRPLTSDERGTGEWDSGVYVVDPANKNQVPTNVETLDSGTKIPVFLYSIKFLAGKKVYLSKV